MIFFRQFVASIALRTVRLKCCPSGIRRSRQECRLRRMELHSSSSSIAVIDRRGCVSAEAKPPF